MIQIDTSSEWEALLQNNPKTLVVADFNASWCGPCESITPEFEKLALANPAVVCVKVDVDVNDEVTEKLGVTALPTFLFFRGGKQVDKYVGSTAADLRSLFDANNNEPAPAVETKKDPGASRFFSGGCVTCERADYLPQDLVREAPNGGAAALAILSDPTWRGEWWRVQRLNLSNCNFAELPSAVARMPGLLNLDVSHNPTLYRLPDSLAQCERLEVFFMSNCPRIVRIPRVLGRMLRLTTLEMKSNNIATIHPDALPPFVISMILTDNRLSSIDTAVFFKLTSVKKLMLSNNNLIALPGPSMASMRSLELIRLENNRLSELPRELLELPRLCWISAAGNAEFLPLSSLPRHSEAASFEDLDADDSQDGVLRKGSSGEVRAARWHDRKVAFKQLSYSSLDGKATDEALIWSAVGSCHPNIISCPAELNENDVKGILMERLPRGYTNLAPPLTITEVTTDRCEETQTLAASAVLRTLRNVASALLFLHSELGVAHGDVCGNNIYTSPDDGTAQLCDFGASFHYTGSTRVDGHLIERCEVRAFGLLVNDMTQRINLDGDKLEQHRRVATSLTGLAAQCVGEKVVLRPSFAQVAGILAEME